MEEGNYGGTVIGRMKVFALKYADDVGLEEMLASLAEVAAENDMQINTEKTNIMVFRKGAERSKKEKWGLTKEKQKEQVASNTWGFDLQQETHTTSTRKVQPLGPESLQIERG